MRRERQRLADVPVGHAGLRAGRFERRADPVHLLRRHHRDLRPSGRPAPTDPYADSHASANTDPRGDADTRALWTHFLECVRSRNQDTLCPADLGYAAIATVNLGVDSYRSGKAYFFDKENGQVSEADESWAKKWEKVSHNRGKPNHVMGWEAGDEGSLLFPPEYQKLEGDWVDGQDPAKRA